MRLGSRRFMHQARPNEHHFVASCRVLRVVGGQEGVTLRPSQRTRGTSNASCSMESFSNLSPITVLHPNEAVALIRVHPYLQSIRRFRRSRKLGDEATPCCSAGFQTCRVADFQIGGRVNGVRSAGLETRDTADLEVCATPIAQSFTFSGVSDSNAGPSL